MLALGALALHRQGSSFMLVLPSDERNLLAPVALTLPVGPSGLRVADVLATIHQHYQQELSPEEQLAIMNHKPHLRRTLQVRADAGRVVAPSVHAAWLNSLSEFVSCGLLLVTTPFTMPDHTT